MMILLVQGDGVGVGTAHYLVVLSSRFSSNVGRWAGASLLVWRNYELDFKSAGQLRLPPSCIGSEK